jgi:alpha-glucuronidase
VSCGEAACSAEWAWSGAAGHYSIAVQYFDLQGGAARFALIVNNQPVANWLADATLPSKHPNGDNSTRHTVFNIDLNPGDIIRIEGIPDGADPAALDYIELERYRTDVPVI